MWFRLFAPKGGFPVPGLVDLVVPGTLSCHSAGEAWEQGSVLVMLLQALCGFPKGR